MLGGRSPGPSGTGRRVTPTTVSGPSTPSTRRSRRAPIVGMSGRTSTFANMIVSASSWNWRSTRARTLTHPLACRTGNTGAGSLVKTVLPHTLHSTSRGGSQS